MTSYTAQRTTYDLSVEGLHTYYVLAGATPVLVHNCGSGGDDDLVTVYRGTDQGLANMIAEESGHLMSDAARSTYAGTGSMEEAMKASQQAHADALQAWGSLDNYVQAHGSFGTEMA